MDGVNYLLAAFTGFAVVGASVYLIVEWIARGVQKKKTDDLPPVDDKTKAAIAALVDQWSSLSDADFWNKLADYVDPAKQKSGAIGLTLTLGDQFIFMNITKEIAGSSGGFIWDSAQDESDMADTFVAAYKSGGAAPMYRKAAATTYDGAGVPRIVMADVLSLALAWVGAPQSAAVTS